MRRSAMLVLLAPSVVALVVPLSLTALPGAPLSATMLESSRGRSIQVTKLVVNCAAYNGFAPTCLNQGNGAACFACSNTGNVTYLQMQPPGSPAPGVRYNQNQNANCGNLQQGTCKNQVCTNPGNIQGNCIAPNNIQAQP